METPEALEPSILDAVARHRWLVLLCVVASLVLAALYTYATPRQYVAEALIAVQDPRTASLFQGTGAYVPPQRYAANQVAIVETPAVAERAAELSEGSGLTASDYLRSADVGSDADSDIITVRFRADTAELAQTGANTLVDAYQQEQAEQASENTSEAIGELEATIAEIDAQLAVSASEELPDEAQTAQRIADIQRRAELQSRIDELRVDSQLASTGTTLVSLAPLPRSANTGGLRLLFVAGAFGLLLGAGLAYLLTVRRRTVDSRLEPGLVLGAPMLAEVPDFADERLDTGLPVVGAMTSASAEAFRFAAGALDIRLSSLSARSLVAVSALLGEGKSTVVANVAIAIARQSRRVLVIDADFGNQAASQLLLGSGQHRHGITELASGIMELEQVVQHARPLPNVKLDVLTRGRVGVAAPDFFQSERMTTLMDELYQRYDVILIDAPPLLQVAYASALLHVADAALVVVPHGVAIAEVEELADRLQFIGRPVVGYIYNRAPLRAEMVASEGSMADTLGMTPGSGAEDDRSGSGRGPAVEAGGARRAR